VEEFLLQYVFDDKFAARDERDDVVWGGEGCVVVFGFVGFVAAVVGVVVLGVVSALCRGRSSRSPL
jgi:hypothetical protein